ncbi:MAG: hypothetical protein V3V12_01470 [Gammaproteobacteria bacterium]
MKQILLTSVTPPIAVCKYGCASCCAAPIAVFWLAGVVSIIYGFLGGPANLMGPSWNTIALGFALWAIAGVWAALTIRGADAEKCGAKKNPPLCKPFSVDDSDPFDEVKKAKN